MKVVLSYKMRWTPPKKIKVTISIKTFVTAIYDAVSMASEFLAARNHKLFSKCFTQVEDNSAGDDAPILGVEKQLSPKMVRLEYPGVDPASDGTNTVSRFRLLH